ncbi:cellulose binding domain-containing protein [Herbidospora yilanensis]|uniref:cellulose binding domain-containing protein n=1 Tax=Herbidospora yilanensis TaxID=354426 RepID=UPI000782B5F2|nr:cellulose binding domain-containing protein [Herbidospora yilanensis]
MATVAGMVMTMLAVLGVSVALAPPAHAQVISDIAYAPAQPAGSRGHLLDLHLPSTGITPRPLIIWHSGSAWTSDDSKPGAADIAAIFNPLGFAVAGVNVRSSAQAIFPAQVHDIKAAIRWLRANAATYQLDPNRFAMAGDSSGAWLTQMAVFSGGVAALEGTLGTTGVSSAVSTGLAFYSPTDFLQMNAQNLPTGGLDHDSPASPESLLVGCPIQTCPAAVAAANPMTYVDANDPPLLFLHGQADFLVPHGQSVLLFNRIKAQCGNATFVSVPAADHMMVQIMDPAQYGNETVRTTANCGETVSTGTLNPSWPNFTTWLRSGLKLGNACEVTYSTGAWNGAFNGSVVVKNTGASPVQGWTVTWTWSGNQQITSAWNATVTQVGNQVTARDAGHNAYIGPNNNSQSFGFAATATGTNAIPAQFKMNNIVCTRVP